MSKPSTSPLMRFVPGACTKERDSSSMRLIHPRWTLWLRWRHHFPSAGSRSSVAWSTLLTSATGSASPTARCRCTPSRARTVHRDPHGRRRDRLSDRCRIPPTTRLGSGLSAGCAPPTAGSDQPLSCGHAVSGPPLTGAPHARSAPRHQNLIFVQRSSGAASGRSNAHAANASCAIRRSPRGTVKSRSGPPSRRSTVHCLGPARDFRGHQSMSGPMTAANWGWLRSIAASNAAGPTGGFRRRRAIANRTRAHSSASSVACDTRKSSSR